MKQLLPLLIFLCAAFGLNAQNISLTVGGTVTDTNGDPVEGVELQIFTDSSSITFGYYNLVTTNAQGQYTDTFDVPGSLTQGALFVTMADCNGALIYATTFWNPGNTDLILDFTYCDVQNSCDVFISPTGSGQLWADAAGVAPYSYQWSTGDITQSIAPNTTGVYCVTVTDATGCVASACYDFGTPIDTTCYVYIALQGNTAGGLLVEAIGSGAPPYSYVWSTGETTNTILISTSGQYCVTLTDNQGCTSVACADANVLPCDVDIEVDSSSLTAIAAGEAPFTYSWSSGSTSATIIPDVDGQYCVTVTDADSCQASACYYWSTAVDTTCFVSILPVQGGTMLEAIADGVAPFSYLWNTGEDTPYVFVTAAGGDYCVNVTDALGCQASACYTIAPTDNYQIRGFVHLADSSTIGGPLEGDVYLIQYDGTAGTLTAVDTVPLLSTAFGSGSYDFGDVPAGDYLIKAALSPASLGYADNLPTYYGNVLWWNEATTVTVPFSGWGYFDIVLVEGNNPGGPGFIGGLVTDGANLATEPIHGRGGLPLAGVSIILLDDFNQPVAYTYTNENGEFEFPSLAWGTYQVVLELPGHEQASYTVTLGPDNPSIQGLSFEVTEGGILSVEVEALAAHLNLFPVPTRDQLSVQFEAPAQGEAQLFISDYSGRILYRQAVDMQQGLQQFNLNTSTLPAGLYTLGIQVKDGITGKQFVKE